MHSFKLTEPGFGWAYNSNFLDTVSKTFLEFYSARGRANRMLDQNNEIMLATQYGALKMFLLLTSKIGRAIHRLPRTRRILSDFFAFQLLEISTDLLDDLIRRERQGQPGLGTIPFLQPENEFYPKRNQARQYLSTMETSSLLALAANISCELEWRFPSFVQGDIPKDRQRTDILHHSQDTFASFRASYLLMRHILAQIMVNPMSPKPGVQIPVTLSDTTQSEGEAAYKPQHKARSIFSSSPSPKDVLSAGGEGFTDPLATYFNEAASKKENRGVNTPVSEWSDCSSNFSFPNSDTDY